MSVKSESLRLLRFNNPVFHVGLNVTVRKGLKWASLQPGEAIIIGDTNSELCRVKVAFTAKIDIGADGGPAALQALIPYEHDPSCRTLDGIIAGLDATYGIGAWRPLITVVGFVV